MSAGTGTEVTLSLSAELRGVKKVMMSRSVQSAMDSEVAALDTAKAFLEGRWRATAAVTAWPSAAAAGRRRLSPGAGPQPPRAR